MTDKEFINSVDKMTTEKLFEELEDIGCDGYYRDIWSATVGELKHRIKKAEQEPKQGYWDKDGACPFCGYLQQWDDDNYCGHCGAKLTKINQDINQD